MTPDQIKLKELLDSSPTSWVELTTEEQALLRNTLRPENGFTVEQTELLSHYWLPVTEAEIVEINRILLPSALLLGRVALQGDMWISADVLTDCMNPRDTYFGIRHLLAVKPITLKESTDFPSYED